MISRTFALRPFPGSLCLPAIGISGRLQRQGLVLAVSYTVSGRLADVILPPPATVPARRWLLWEATCLELFLALTDEERYWEFNLSPSGDWNVFRLSGYRQGIAEEEAITTLPVTVTRTAERLDLHVEVDLQRLLPPELTWRIGISAVLEHPLNRFTYWALFHPGSQPDFHHQDGFILTL